jgi:uncharacterized protein YqhQ
MIFQIFQIRKQYKDIQSGVQNPGQFGEDTAKGFVLGAFILPVIFVFLATVASFILGYTDLIIEPLGIFRLFFWLALIAFVGAVFVIGISYSLIRRVRKGAENRFSKPYDYDVTPK